MLTTKVVIVAFHKIQSSLQVLQMLDMFAIYRYAWANTKFKVPADTIQLISITINLLTNIKNTSLQMIQITNMRWTNNLPIVTPELKIPLYFGLAT